MENSKKFIRTNNELKKLAIINSNGTTALIYNNMAQEALHSRPLVPDNFGSKMSMWSQPIRTLDDALAPQLGGAASSLSSKSLPVFDPKKRGQPYPQTSTQFLEMLLQHLRLPERERRASLFGKMMRKFVPGINRMTTKQIHKIRNDMELYKMFWRWLHPVNSIAVEPHNAELRAQRRAAEVAEIFDAAKVVPGKDRYLDYGCSDGRITGAIAKLLDIKEVWGTDVPSWHGIENKMVDKSVNFVPVIDGKIPVKELPDHVDLLTALMVLHHIPPEKLDATIATLTELVAPGGYLLVREHDAIDKDTITYCHIEHAMYDLVVPEKPFWGFYDEYVANYLPVAEWEELIEKSGLLKLIYTGKPFGVTRYTWLLFRKIEAS